jgi:RND family efflux transporter MFP subunit
MGPIDVEAGESVTPHVKVASVFNVNSVYVDIGVIEKDIGKIRIAQPVRVSVDAYAGVVKDAVVTAISPVIEGKSRNFKVTAKVAGNAGDTTFLPGMFARASIEVFSQDQARVIPLSAVRDGFVYVVENGIAVKKPISTGYRSYDYAVVTGGLKGGETIIAEPEGSFDDAPQVEVVNTHAYKADA